MCIFGLPRQNPSSTNLVIIVHPLLMETSTQSEAPAVQRRILLRIIRRTFTSGDTVGDLLQRMDDIVVVTLSLLPGAREAVKLARLEKERLKKRECRERAFEKRMFRSGTHRRR
jgi:hypothetical protein